MPRFNNTYPIPLDIPARQREVVRLTRKLQRLDALRSGTLRRIESIVRGQSSAPRTVVGTLRRYVANIDEEIRRTTPMLIMARKALADEQKIADNRSRQAAVRKDVYRRGGGRGRGRGRGSFRVS